MNLTSLAESAAPLSAQNDGDTELSLGPGGAKRVVNLDDKPIYAIEEVAEILGFTLRTLVEDCRRGRIEHVYRDKHQFMTPDQIRALLRQLTRKPRTTRAAEADADELDRRLRAKRLGRAA